MKINKLEIENIASYGEDSDPINFKPGNNFISGLNGHGKSTIFKAIQQALYPTGDSNTERINLLRKGCRKGNIKVWFEINDTACHLRLILKENSDSFRLEINNGEKVISTKEEVIETLNKWENMTGDRKKIFDNVVGVEQNGFTTPFLMTNKGRKEYFNTILDVDKYKRIADTLNRLRIGDGVLKKRIEELKEEHDYLKGRVANYPEEKKALRECDRQVKERGKEAEAKEKQLKERKELLGRLQEKEKELKSLREEITLLKENIKHQNQTEGSLVNSLNEAVLAGKIVEENTGQYQLHEAARKKLPELNKRRDEKDRLERERNTIQKRIETGEARITVMEDELNKARAKNKEALAMNTSALEEIKPELESARKDVSDIEEVFTSGAVKTGALQSVEKDISALQNRQANLKDLEMKAAGLKKETGEIAKQILALGDFKTVEEEKEKLEKQKEKVLSEIAVSGQKIKDLKEKIAKSADGICPIINEKCGRIDPERFQSQLEQEGKIHSDHTAKLDALAKGLSRLEEKLKGKQRAVKLNAEKETLEKQWKDRKAEAEKLLAAVHHKPLAVPGEINDLVFSAGLDTVINSQGLSAYLEVVKEEAGVYRKNLEAFQKETNKKRDEARGNMTRIEAEQKGLLDLRQQIQKEAGTFRKREEEILGRRKAIEKEKEALQEAADRLKPLANIADEISALNESLEKTKHAADLYQENIKMAQRLEGKKEELAKHQENLERIRNALKEAEETAVQKQSEFDPDELASCKAGHERLAEEYNTAAGELVGLRKQLVVLKKHVEELTEEYIKFNNVKEGLKQEQKKEKALKFIVDTFKNSGALIVEKMINRISSQANMIFSRIFKEPSELSWDREYNVSLTSPSRHERNFKQLSGGEQMICALAVRLAIAREFNQSDFIILDEPTVNVDHEKCEELAETISTLTREIKGLKQMFIVSHDNTFERVIDNVIRVQKENDCTRVG
ncbi:MAG: SMC family ATPase [bacterium]|nr:SMC family ATPase [bacterium]